MKETIRSYESSAEYNVPSEDECHKIGEKEIEIADKLSSSEVELTEEDKDEKIIGDSDWRDRYGNPHSPTWDHAKLESGRKEKRVRQEHFERALNETFIPINELEAIFSSGAELATKRYEEYDGKRIAVYNTGNVQFRWLAHSIEWDGAEGHPLVENPALWTMSEDEVRQYMPIPSNMLSMQYCDSIIQRKKVPNTEIRYGFLHFPAASVATTSIGTGQRLDKTIDMIDLRDDLLLDGLPDRIAKASFLEVQAFRYDEQGRPAFWPDFIEAPCEGVNENTLKQAAFFGVPVFEIPRKEVEKPKTALELILESIDDEIEKELSWARSEDVPILKEQMRTLANTPASDWARKDRMVYDGLFKLVKQKEEEEGKGN